MNGDLMVFVGKGLEGMVAKSHNNMSTVKQSKPGMKAIHPRRQFFFRHGLEFVVMWSPAYDIRDEDITPINTYTREPFPNQLTGRPHERALRHFFMRTPRLAYEHEPCVRGAITPPDAVTVEHVLTVQLLRRYAELSPHIHPSAYTSACR